MTATLSTVLRVGTALAAVALLVAGGVLGYIAVVAARRSEGVFLPAGYVALLCLGAAAFIGRAALRW